MRGKSNHIDVSVSFLIVLLALYWYLGDDCLLDSVCDITVLEGSGDLVMESFDGATPITELSVTRKKAREPAGLLVPLGLVLLEALVVNFLMRGDGCVPDPLRGVARSHDGVV